MFFTDSISTAPSWGESRALPKRGPRWSGWRAGTLGQRTRQHWLVCECVEVKEFDSGRWRAGCQGGEGIYSSLPPPLLLPLWSPILCRYKQQRRKNLLVPSMATSCSFQPVSLSFPIAGQHTADSQVPRWTSVLKAGTVRLRFFF